MLHFKTEKMKRTTFTLLLFVTFAISAAAQATLPYTNGFDTNAELADWIIHRKGLLHNYKWAPYAAPGAVTAPNYAFHDYPVGSAGTQAVDDWLVTPDIDLTSGARLSLKAWVFIMGSGVLTGDSIEIWLLKGNRDPDLAVAKTRITSLRHFAANMGSYSQPAWKDTANIVIPPTAGPAYIAFRYKCLDNWYTVGLDNIRFVANTTGVTQVHTGTQFQLYPNPAASEIKWNLLSGNAPQLNKEQGVITNALGQELKRFAVKDGSLDIGFLQPGIYYVRIGDAVLPFTRL